MIDAILILEKIWLKHTRIFWSVVGLYSLLMATLPFSVIPFAGIPLLLIAFWLGKRFVAMCGRMKIYRREFIQFMELGKPMLEESHFAFRSTDFHETLPLLRDDEERIIRSLKKVTRKSDGNQVDLVVHRRNNANLLLVKKNFFESKYFYREGACLLRLKSIPHVPKMFRADRESLTIWMSYVPGNTLESLRIEQREEFERLGQEYGDKADQIGYLLREKRLFGKIKDLLALIHQHDLSILGLHFSNVVYDSKGDRLSFIDFEKGEYYPKNSIEFLLRRYIEIEGFNKRFLTDLPNPKPQQVPYE